MNIGTKINEYRRRKGATQEDLANYTGVSTAAVSKLETEASLPDITLLPKIAEFLEVSIDVLMDFELHTDHIDELRHWDNRYLRTKDYNAGIPVYEEALLRYPNDGNLHLGLGELLSAKASENPCLDTGLRAVEHLEKARKLGCWMTEHGNERDLKQQISFTYGCIGEYEKALSYIEDSMYDILAADYEIKLGKYDQAKIRLQSKLFHTAFDFALLTDRLSKCFAHEGENDMPFLLQSLCTRFRKEFTYTFTANYFHRLSAIDHMNLAVYYRDAGNHEQMISTIEEAVRLAAAFDIHPDYDMSSVGFMQGMSGSISTSGNDLACEGILNRLKCDFSDFVDKGWYITCTEELTAAMRSKKDIGLWE